MALAIIFGALPIVIAIPCLIIWFREFGGSISGSIAYLILVVAVCVFNIVNISFIMAAK